MAAQGGAPVGSEGLVEALIERGNAREFVASKQARVKCRVIPCLAALS
jgi:hypothetical protein